MSRSSPATLPGPVTITDVVERRSIAISDAGTLFRMGRTLLMVGAEVCDRLDTEL